MPRLLHAILAADFLRMQLGFSNTLFQEQVSAALVQARQLLSTTQEAKLFDGSFEASFLVAEQLTQVLHEGLGSLLFPVQRPEVRGQSWSLRCSNVEKRKFWETTREVRSAAVHERSYSSGQKVTDYTITTQKVYNVALEDEWSIVAFEGADAQANALTLFSGKGSHERVGDAWTHDVAKSFQESWDVNVTSMLQRDTWRIRDRRVIPSRSKPVQDACELARNIASFAVRCVTMFTNKENFAGNSQGIFALSEAEAFHLAPLVVGEKLVETSVLLADFERRWKLAQSKIEGPQVFADLRLISRLNHTRILCWSYLQSVFYLEKRMYEALVSVIGKSVSESDLEAYMRWHNSQRARAPTDFAYAVRRADNDPEGIVALENAQGEPIKVFSVLFSLKNSELPSHVRPFVMTVAFIRWDCSSTLRLVCS
jgi:hypothetical protein